MQALKPLDVVHIRKLMGSPEEWDGNILNVSNTDSSDKDTTIITKPGIHNAITHHPEN